MIACPTCGGTEEIRYLEDITCERRVCNEIATDEPTRQTVVDGYYTTEGWDELADNPRLLCRSCEVEFPIPDEMEIDWL
jgi:uncharacterized protein YbaR (Trm112 family)